MRQLQQRQAILGQHGIASKIEGGRLLALELWSKQDANGVTMSGSEWIDVTDWSTLEFREWLGY